MNKYYASVIFLLASFFAEIGYAQNIEGDTIFVNTYVEAQITFPSEVEDARFIPVDTYKEILFPISGTYILLHSKIENSKKAIMVIKEGGREHHFIIVYKKNINQYDFREYTYNYKTLKLLKKHVEESSVKKPAEPIAIAEKPTPRNSNKNDNKVKEEKPVDTAPDYYALLEKGNEAYKKESYEEAIGIYEKAKLLKPTDDIAQIKIDQARGKLGEIAKQEQLENEKKYNALKNEARNYLDQRKYEKAKEVFEKAKYIMPGDGYPIRQIENINKLIAQEAEQKKLQEQVSRYNNYMSEGDKSFNDKKLPEAEAAYRSALSINQYDKKALGRLKAIDELKKQQEFNDELENRYKAALAVADKLVDAADYNNAITEYNNALRIFPRSYPKDKIKVVSKIISDRIKEVNRVLADQRTQENEKRRILALQKDTNDKYEAKIANAGVELRKNNYALAKNLYKQAAALKPLETLPVSQMDLIEIKLGQIAFDKRKREDSMRQAKETDRNYDLAITQGKSYYLKEELLQAKIAYEAASDLKPQKDEPKKQLALINNKLAEIQRDNEINDRFDSLTAIGDSLLVLKEFDQAVINYKAASQIKPASLYPVNQVKYIRSEIKYLADQEAIRKKNEEERVRWEAAEKKYKESIQFLGARKKGDSAVAAYRSALSRGDSVLIAKKLTEARNAFKEALSLRPDDEYVLSRLKGVQYQYDLLGLGNEEKLAEQKQAAKKLEEEKPTKEKKKKKRKKNKEEEEQGKPEG
ncbi:MAG: hypothetical protein ABI707_08815 [Ferruginibacter sp.]